MVMTFNEHRFTGFKLIHFNILQAIKTRFASTLDSKEALLAAVTIPKFKLRWLRDEAKKDAAKCLLAAECRAPGHPLPEELPHRTCQRRTGRLFFHLQMTKRTQIRWRLKLLIFLSQESRSKH